MLRRILSAIAILLTLCTAAPAKDRLIFSTQALPPFSKADGTGFIDIVFREIGHRAGFKVAVVQQPERRSLDMTNSGENDGDGPRVPGLEQRYTNLVRTREPLLIGRFTAFTRKGDRITCWEDLAEKHVTLPKGWTLPRRSVPESTVVKEVPATHHGMAMLAVGRVDAALTILKLGQYEIRQNGLVTIDPNPPILIEQDLYLYLHKRHADLIPAIDEAIRSMRADGTWDRLYAETVNRLE